MGQLIVNLDSLLHNITYLSEYCRLRNINLTGVLKGPGYDPVIIKAFEENTITSLGFSHSPLPHENAIRFKKKPVCVSLPSLHQVEQVIRFFDTSFNSELTVIKRINETLLSENLCHNILLMIDTGDRREGLQPDETIDTVKKVLEINNKKFNIIGIGTNFGCHTGNLPDKNSLQTLHELALLIEKQYGIPMNVVSIGGSVLLEWLENNSLPSTINNVRFGEAFFMGTIPTINKKHPALKDDVFTFTSDILETSEKLITPPQVFGKNALGKTPRFNKKGKRKIAILNFGITSTYPEGLVPIDKGIEIICINSNYTLIDYTDSKNHLKIGDFIEFRCELSEYASMLYFTAG